jgi:hypothetical protein
MFDEGLFNHSSSDPDLAENSYYFVVGIRADAWDPDGQFEKLTTKSPR